MANDLDAARVERKSRGLGCLILAALLLLLLAIVLALGFRGLWWREGAPEPQPPAGLDSGAPTAPTVASRFLSQDTTLAVFER